MKLAESLPVYLLAAVFLCAVSVAQLYDEDKTKKSSTFVKP